MTGSQDSSERTYTKSLAIPGPAGRLEAVLMTPADEPRAAAVMCHAHPLHGGVMHFKLLYRVAKIFQREGFAVLRFNFRGVGGSEGEHDHGRGEEDDVRAAVDELERAFPARPLVLGGFSFGAVMALRAGVRDERIRALLAMGLPIDTMPEASFLETSSKPRLFVQGELDEFGGREAIERFVASLPEPRRLVVVSGADHFFTGQVDVLEKTVAEWLASRPWEIDR